MAFFSNLHATFHCSKNYGAFLQAFALQKYLDCTTLNFIPSYQYIVGNNSRKVPLLWRILALYRYYKKRAYQMMPELKMLNLTNRYSLVEQILSSNLQANTFIVGSDQVWNPRFIANREQIYFLAFAPLSAKRISYAASLGMAKWPKDFEQKVLPWLQKFQAISVREESNVPYLTSLGLSNVVCVCDPTILHKGDFYRRKFSIVQALHTMPLQPFVFVYKIRETLPNAVQETLTNTKTITVDLQKKKTMVSVSDWLANIDHAEWIITDSFHCAVFCILFHKQFVVIPNRSTGVGMNERFATILGKTGLEYRMLQGNEFKEKFQEKLNRPVDWNKIDSILEDWRTYSGNWLKNALE